jgi:hypothetical protein
MRIYLLSAISHLIRAEGENALPPDLPRSPVWSPAERSCLVYLGCLELALSNGLLEREPLVLLVLSFAAYVYNTLLLVRVSIQDFAIFRPTFELVWGELAIQRLLFRGRRSARPEPGGRKE